MEAFILGHAGGGGWFVVVDALGVPLGLFEFWQHSVQREPPGSRQQFFIGGIKAAVVVRDVFARFPQQARPVASMLFLDDRQLQEGVSAVSLSQAREFSVHSGGGAFGFQVAQVSLCCGVHTTSVSGRSGGLQP